MASGFLDFLNDPSGESQIVLGQMIKGIATGQGPEAGVQLAAAFEAKRKADRADKDSVGMLSEIMAGNTDFADMAQRYSGADRNVWGPLAAAKIAEGRVRDQEDRALGREQDKAAETAQAYGGIVERMQDAVVPGAIAAPDPGPVAEWQMPADFTQPPPAAAPPADVVWRGGTPLEQITPEMVPGSSARGFIDALSKASDLDNRKRLAESTVSEIQARLARATIAELEAARKAAKDENDAVGLQLLASELARRGLVQPGTETFPAGPGSALLTGANQAARQEDAQKDRATVVPAGTAASIEATTERSERAAADRAAEAQRRDRDAAQKELEEILEAARKQTTPELQKKYIDARASTIGRLKARGATVR